MQLKDLASPAFYENPYPFYEALRAAGPLVELGSGIWVTGRYSVVDSLLRDRRMGRAYMRNVRARYGEERAKAHVFRSFEQMMLLMNPPDHTRLRRLLMQVFNARQTESFRHMAQVIADHLIDGFVHTGSADLMADFATPLPIKVICTLLDVSLADESMFTRSVGAIVHALEVAPMSDDQIDQANQAALELEAYFQDIMRERRRCPGNDLISMLLTTADGDDRLSDEEIAANIVLMFVAGHETTSNMIGNALIALHQDRAEWDRIVAAPEHVPDAVAECLRYDPSVQMTGRAALEEIDIAGVHLQPEEMIFLCLGSANRDPERFSEPARLMPGRAEKDARLLSFGGGIHHCLGARLATAELEVALDTLARRLPGLRLTGLEHLRWHQRNTLRGVESLTARWQ
ncbi:cytochrome P450 [Tahibacter amnicola]|uniref:Cytochrome P450 n=1 Tax=Tahibacter amnicola TaxID=2976241 RepID=A0ABY6BBK8_9GAMM|nr:cytochrome P450 [Tahibacter amnicola]UXI67245.1 cytochrome P450 [Tahibacter amnicola]